MGGRLWITAGAVSLAATLLLVLTWLGGNTRLTKADTFRVFIDANTGDGICDLPEDSSVSVAKSSSFEVAVCVESPPSALGSFSFDVVYDDTIILAPEVADSGTALDDNPDANQAALGGAWDCSGFNLAFPTGDADPVGGADHGKASIICLSLTGPFSFTSTGDIALIDFDTKGVDGNSSLALQNVIVGDAIGAEMGSCNPSISFPMPCVDGSVTVGGAAPPGATPTLTPGAPSPSPTATSGLPAATSTPQSSTLTPAPTPLPEGMEAVDLFPGCNPVASTYPDGSDVQTLAAAVSPFESLTSIWKLVAGRWSAYSPESAEASDLKVTEFLDVVFLCAVTPGTFVRPLVQVQG
jgi:hypothetical protein